MDYHLKDYYYRCVAAGIKDIYSVSVLSALATSTANIKGKKADRDQLMRPSDRLSANKSDNNITIINPRLHV